MEDYARVDCLPISEHQDYKKVDYLHRSEHQDYKKVDYLPRSWILIFSTKTSYRSLSYKKFIKNKMFSRFSRWLDQNFFFTKLADIYHRKIH